MSTNVIKLLPDSVANQIAAGEVIQRPASVIKELVENAIDAGASSVQIVLKDGGKTLIQVIDNGCGMTDTDARLAFERHATSKIRQADDLFTLSTMGFRGEALPSIAAVSEVEMRTQKADDSIGTRLIINASQVQLQEPYMCAVGTNIMVRHLFHNFVARRRFLKKDSIELSHIMHEFERLALVNTNVEFSLTHNDTLLNQLPKSPLKQRIGSLFGKSVEKQIIPIDTETSVVKISGFIGLPEAARKRNQLQFFFVNGRNMRHPYFHKAVLNCYKELIGADVQPNYFINFELPPDRIDVNIHPQKHEIKFEDETLVWQILTAAIKESLGKFNVGPAIDFNATDVPDIPPFRGDDNDAPSAPVSDDFDPTYSPFADNPFGPASEQPLSGPKYSASAHSTSNIRSVSSAINRDWEKLYETFTSATSNTGPAANHNDSQANTLQFNTNNPDGQEQTLEQIAEAHGFSTSMLEVKNRYIVTDSKSGLMIIDRYRAHIRVLYDNILPKINSGKMSSQMLLIPETFELDSTRSALLKDNIDKFMALGFNIAEDVSTSLTWNLTAMPSELQPSQAIETLKNIIADICELTDAHNQPSAWHQKAALSLAKAAAIRSGRPMSEAEMERLLTDLFRVKSPNYTPDGLPVIRILPIENITSLFNR